jgi:glutamine cyclotransferase
LEYFGGFLYEGTGLKGRSGVRKVDLETGKVVQEERLQPGYFGEGITIAQGRLFQLTWQDKTGFVYDAKTLTFIRNFSYFGEGWGLTHDPSGLIMSDGTSTLRFLELTRFQERRRVKVTDAGVPIERLNELEWVRGEIWANVWETDYIVRISPKEGRVLGWINLRGLLGGPAAKLPPEAVLNGIAYDAQTQRIFVTGKLWPRIFEIAVK